jgi:hypothetical protein
MFVSSWFPWKLARQGKGRSRPSHSPGVRRGTRLALEQLEDRTVPSSFTAATVTDLINDINYANAHPGSHTITLVAGNTFTLTAADNSTDGGNGLPVIAAKDNLTIQGNGDTIERGTASGTPAFRLFDVASGASLTLANVTLQGGLASGSGVAAEGGGIYSSGSLTLEAGTLITGNTASGPNGPITYYWYDPFLNGWYYSGPGGPALGGGLYVAGGTATLTNVTVSSNSAQGGDGSQGGFACGGGLYVAGGTVTLTNAAVSSNAAQGGVGSFARDGDGGGLYVAGGTVTLTSDILSSNSAVGGRAMGMGIPLVSTGAGGALYVAGGTVTLTSDILSSNSAVGGIGNGYGVGGGLYVAFGTVTLCGDTVTGNSAIAGEKGATATGGGLYINATATVYLDAFTVTKTKRNKPDNITGTYILI